MKRLLFLVFGAFILNTASSQIVISEVMINPDPTDDVGKEWIEITNVSNTTINLSNWTLFVATRKSIGSTRPGNYWWPFPKTGPGSYLPSGKRIVIRWLAPKQPGKSHSGYDEVFTGNTVFDFLFGLFHYDASKTPVDTDMQLPDNGGAIGLLRTQNANEVILPAYWVDFVEYGSSGFLREGIPIKGGIWKSGSYVPIPNNGKEWPVRATLAYAGWGNSPLNYWCDTTPTMGAPNAKGAVISYYGQGCNCNKNPLKLNFPIPATVGNNQFRFYVTNAFPGDFGIGIMSHKKESNLTFLGCHIYVNPYVMVTTKGKFANSKGEFLEELFIPPLKEFIGFTFYSQYLQLTKKSFNGTYCGSNGGIFSIGE